VIEDKGNTTLVQTGDHYYLNVADGTAGPELKLNGDVPGQDGGLTPIGAEQTASGYDVAFISADGHYSVWSAGADGNCKQNLTGDLAANSAKLEAYEQAVFQQDLNGDGVTGLDAQWSDELAKDITDGKLDQIINPDPGPTTTVIESNGNESLVLSGGHYYFSADGTASGPELTFNGAAVTPGDNDRDAIAVEQHGTGFEVVMKAEGSDTYNVWETDANGNYQSSLTGDIAGSSATMGVVEAAFHQDLNGDGVTGMDQQTADLAKLIQHWSNLDLGTTAAGNGIVASGTDSMPPASPLIVGGMDSTPASPLIVGGMGSVPPASHGAITVGGMDSVPGAQTHDAALAAMHDYYNSISSSGIGSGQTIACLGLSQCGVASDPMAHGVGSAASLFSDPHGSQSFDSHFSDSTEHKAA